MQNNHQVEKIKEYLAEKIASLKEKAKQFESPIMQEMAKNSSHLQYDYTRLQTKIEENEDILLAIEKFTSSPTIKTEKKQKKEPGNEK